MKLARIKEFLSTKMRNRYRLIIRNDRNLEERISIILTPLNVVLLMSGLLVFFTAVAIFLLPITPLRYFMPGGGEINPRDFSLLQNRLDSIERGMRLQEQRDSNLLRILQGDIDSIETEEDEVSYFEHSFPQAQESIGWLSVFPSASAANANQNKNEQSPEKGHELRLTRNYAFFPPLKGVVTDTFNVRNKHTAVDVVSYSNAAVKATLDGTVVLSSWTPETGHVMLLQHTDNLISVYKHNAVLLKQQGAHVSAGEVIAIVGNSGELTSGPHLHFELWQNGQAVNPQDYIKF